MRDYFHHYLLGFILWLMCALPGYTADTLTANALLDDLRRQVDAAEQTGSGSNLNFCMNIDTELHLVDEQTNNGIVHDG